MKLSEKILYCRRKAMLSQEALAERIGVSRQAISKWETGEATPEVTKLLQLAQTFSVTTDWLLSDDDPVPETSPEPLPETAPDAAPPTPTHTWIDDVPGMIGTLLRKYGWLFGVRLAVAGALMLAFGLFANLLSSSFFGGMTGTSSSFFSDFGSPGNGLFTSGGVQWYDENGNAISNPFGGSVFPSGSSGAFDSVASTGRSMFGLFSGFIMLLGGVMLIAGVILAIQLKKLNR